jgi:magnesium-transporting ATPase (P-type)
VKLFCKGADTVIFKRLTNSQDGVAEASLKHLEEFARAGYRTLCMAEREVPFSISALLQEQDQL